MEAMIDSKRWMTDLTVKLVDAFDSRLLFVGLQGSYRRKEATGTSDIDVVAILDTVTLADLRTYRGIIASMPHAQLACGFFGGREELRHWPHYELFQLMQDTQTYYGELAPLLPPITPGDVAEGVRIQASALYHSLIHTYLYGSERERLLALRTAYKSSFFLLMPLHWLRTGICLTTRQALCAALNGEEQAILSVGCDLITHQASFTTHADWHFDRLIRWCRQLLTAPDPTRK